MSKAILCLETSHSTYPKKNVIRKGELEERFFHGRKKIPGMKKDEAVRGFFSLNKSWGSLIRKPERNLGRRQESNSSVHPSHASSRVE